MRVIRRLEDAQPAVEVILTIGTFDGVHRGHQYLLGQLVQRARESARLAAALTFHPHPRTVLNPDLRPAYLSTLEERAATLERLGLDLLVVLPFTLALANTPALTFVEALRKQLRLGELWVGPDFALGRGREGNVGALQGWAAELGFALHVVSPLMEGGEAISSTRIRNLLLRGEVGEAARLLGRYYAIAGPVVKGMQKGRLLGFRTANLRLDPERAIPSNGVYAVWATVGSRRYQAVANIGVRPSFYTAGERLLEVHLLDLDSDLYEQTLKVEFVQFLRPEQRFSGVEALVAQLQCDVAASRAALGATVLER